MCNCQSVDKTPLWSPIPQYQQPTAIQQGENIDCYMRRAGSVSGLKNDVGAKVQDLIDNTSLTSDTNLNVNTTFQLTPGSPRVPTNWQIAVNGTNGLSPLTELTWNSSTGALSGTVLQQHANTSYQVLITANDASGIIDSRAFTFYPKSNSKDATIKFLFPLTPAANAHVICGYGPRSPQTFNSSTQHDGIDIAMVDHSLGTIVATADGTVVKVGPSPGYGNWIVIEHRDSQDRLVATSVYGHINDGETYVVVGQKVAGGQKIALEGSSGLTSGAHLHFELHKSSMRNPVDPMAYIDGTYSVAVNNDPTTIGADGTAAPTSYANVTNANTGMTSGEAAQANSSCPNALPADTALAAKSTSQETPPAAPVNNVTYNRSVCATATGTPSSSSVIAAIQAACAADSSLTAYDSQWIQTVATIESNLDPYAKNPTSSATGLYQFVDSLAVKYYGIIGYPPTCVNRCDPTIATKAMIAFYKAEIKPYWTSYQTDPTKLGGRSIVSTAWSQQYSSLNQGEFQYGLIHHDGVGNAAAGKDLGGVAYWRSKVGTA